MFFTTLRKAIHSDFFNTKLLLKTFSYEKPIMVIECKHWDKELIKHERQLFEYHDSSNARLGVLTNGIQYRFYADLDRPNIMDEKPFFEFDITKPDDEQIEVC